MAEEIEGLAAGTEHTRKCEEAKKAAQAAKARELAAQRARELELKAARRGRD
ncbi:hypothetical protein TRIUR3_23891 [Triticum urartu]|uniref:Uncharacterized protein n=1 Tax=Triticum urartu TaxID=4572 RepID=M8A9U2_TRIUA|nr:hypothetical protein TRIUR3_23891 [Triticum urartu]